MESLISDKLVLCEGWMEGGGSLSESREARVPPPAMGRSLPCPSLIIADVKGSRQPPPLDSFSSFTFQIINAFNLRIKGLLKYTVGSR